MSTPAARDAPGGASPSPGGPVRRQRGTSGSRSRSAGPATGPITLTGRGGIVVMFATGLVFALFSRWLDVPVLAGSGFTAGCVLAAFATRSADLPTLVVSPPLVFFAATFAAVFVTTLGDGSLVRGLTVGILTSLAATAPWLFLGTLLVLVISLPRGLVTGVRELRDKLAGSRLFEKEENENPVRWDESPSSTSEHRALPPGEVD